MTGAFASHIGRIETLNETIHPMRMAQAAAMLGLGREAADTLSGEGTALPPLFHLFFTNNTSDAGALNPDGHEKLGGFMPDVTSAGPFEGKPVVRRMWAAGDISFDGHLRVGEMARRTSTITSIEEKKGSTGPLIFVNVERVIEAASGRVTEKRTIVYREPPATTAIAPKARICRGRMACSIISPGTLMPSSCSGFPPSPGTATASIMMLITAARMRAIPIWLPTGLSPP